MERIFLYIDILGFETLVRTNKTKVDEIFRTFDGLKVFKHPALQTVVFSDTILVFNKDESWPDHYYCTYLTEYAQQLFYRLSRINVFFKAIILKGDFNYSNLKNIDAYYGLALINAYHDESELEGFGLYVEKAISDEVVTFDKVTFNEKYDYVFLCQSILNLYDHTSGVLPIKDLNIFSETDTYHRIDEDLRFLREISYIKEQHPVLRVRDKYQKVYQVYKNRLKDFFNKFEIEGFMPFTLNDHYAGSIDPFLLLAEIEITKLKE
ncbi:MAG: hypothetical protein V4456_22165 [Bacteroidota bacterium]